MTMITVAIHCPFCGSTHTVEVPASAYLAWQEGALIQDVMPELSIHEREMLISGMCEACQSSFFEEDDCDLDPDSDDLECGFDPYEGGYTYDC